MRCGKLLMSEWHDREEIYLWDSQKTTDYLKKTLPEQAKTV